MIQTQFSIEPYPQEISYGPSTIWLNTLTIIFGPYQYGQDYLETTNSVSGDWWLNGAFQQANVPYFQNQKLILGPEVIASWGLDDNVIIQAVAAHYGYTLLSV
jgi:hypothetical protein